MYVTVSARVDTALASTSWLWGSVCVVSRLLRWLRSHRCSRALDGRSPYQSCISACMSGITPARERGPRPFHA